MNFVGTRERSGRSNTTETRTVERWVPVSRKNIFTFFHFFLCYDNLREAIKQPGGSSKKLGCSPPGRISLL
nr:unnamed protein product [Callosobruchus analis]